MRSRIGLLFVGVAGLFVFVIVQAGDLEPPAPPAPTMVTLQEISDKLDNLCSNAVTLPRTGQTQCWDASAATIDCAGTGQDGELQAGTSITPRFTDNGDGTVTDNLTTLVWLKDTNCFVVGDWFSALSTAGALADGVCGLSDGSVAGDWRLPNFRQLLSLVDYGHSIPALPSGHPFTNLQINNFFWSSTTYQGSPNLAWILSFVNGDINGHSKTSSVVATLPVRATR